MPAIFEFGRFTIFPHRHDVIVTLVKANGTVVGKDELMCRVWPGRIVEDNNLYAQ